MQALKNLKIKTVTASALLVCALLGGILGGMILYTNGSAKESITLITRININQLNSISRAATLLNLARLDMGLAAYYMGQQQPERAEEAMRGLKDTIATATERYEYYKALPKTSQGEETARALSADFDTVMNLMQQQRQALQRGNLTAFAALRPELKGPSDELEQKLTAFVQYANQRGENMITDYFKQADTFNKAGIGLTALTFLILILIYFGLRRLVVNPLDHAVVELQHIASADLSRPIDHSGRNEIGLLFQAMHAMQESLTGIVGTTRNSIHAIHTGSSEISKANTDMSSRTEQQAASLEETSSSMEQMTATVKQNAENARHASTLANEASATAGHGGEVMTRVDETMQGISDSSNKVAEIIGMIDEIAFQTNLLALNASVEAARAGEQGRGFAVVANEVRSLAGRCAESAQEIKQLVTASTDQVKQGATLVTEASETMHKMVSAARQVTDIIDEISTASQEQSAGIEQVSQAVSQMDQVTQQNAAQVEQTAAAAESLEGQADRLESEIAVFRLAASAATDRRRPALPAAHHSAANRLLSGQQSGRVGSSHDNKPGTAQAGLATADDADWATF